MPRSCVYQFRHARVEQKYRPAWVFVEVVIHFYRHRFGYAGGDPSLVSRDNLDENGGGNQSLKRRPVAKS